MRVLLLTPYTGGNLGDAAIQEGVIANVRSRMPGADIVMLSLSPATTSQLHGVRSFPIGTRTFGAGFPDDAADAGAQATSEKRLTYARVRAAVADRVSRYVGKICRWTGLLELHHVITAFLLARRADLLVVSGGGQLDDYWGGTFRHPYALFKWALIARAARVKVAFLSVGTCTLKPRSQTLVELALNRAFYRSFRDLESKQLAAFAPCTKDDPVYPDLAFSYVPPAARGRGAAESRRLGIGPIAYLSRTWPDKNSSIYDTYLNTLADLIVDRSSLGWRISVFTSDAVDWDAVCDLNDLLIARRADGQVELLRTFTLADFFAEVRRCDAFVASRLHGVVLANLARVPTLAISYDRKVDTYMQDTRMGEYRLDIHQVQSHTLIERTESLAAHKELLAKKLGHLTEEWRQRLHQQYDVVFNEFTSPDTSSRTVGEPPRDHKTNQEARRGSGRQESARGERV